MCIGGQTLPADVRKPCWNHFFCSTHRKQMSEYRTSAWLLFLNKAAVASQKGEGHFGVVRGCMWEGYPRVPASSLLLPSSLEKKVVMMILEPGLLWVRADTFPFILSSRARSHGLTEALATGWMGFLGPSCIILQRDSPQQVIIIPFCSWKNTD